MSNIKLRIVEWHGREAIVVGKRKDGKIMVLTMNDTLFGWVNESEVTFL